LLHGNPVIDADSHKCENPLVFLDYVDPAFRRRIGFVRDRFGEQRFRIVDRRSQGGPADFARVFLQPEGYGKGTYRPYHRETTIGGLFNRRRIEHMDREGIDHQVVYGSVALAFGSLIDPELAVALCRAYNDYIAEDCSKHSDRLHPMAVLPLQAPEEAVREMRRCVETLGMPGVMVPPNLPQPHPAAPDRFPELRVPRHLSHPDFEPVLAAAARLDAPVAIHGAPGMYYAGGTSDQLDSFTLVHVFANRSMLQMALARLIFDGTLEAHPGLRFGFLEAGCGWLPDLMHGLREHWESRIRDFDPFLEPSPAEFLAEFVREGAAGPGSALLGRARALMGTLFSPREDAAGPGELRHFLYEHPKLRRDPLEYLERGQIFLSVEPGDPAPSYLEVALGEVGRRVCGMAVDYGHWDAALDGCVEQIAGRPGIDAEHAVRLVGANALDFYGDRLRRRISPSSAAA
jgi:predicted TIM-barrel fold metal-dependent hydrolase